LRPEFNALLMVAMNRKDKNADMTGGARFALGLSTGFEGGPIGIEAYADIRNDFLFSKDKIFTPEVAYGVRLVFNLGQAGCSGRFTF
jgi:hypothetical protein